MQDLLSNRKAWNEATFEQQEEVIKDLLSSSLRDVFEYEGLQDFSCGGVTNTIAKFKHLPTNMRFHLIPGQADFRLGATKEQLEIIRRNYATDIDEHYGKAIHIRPFLISEYLVTEKAWKDFGGTSLYWNLGKEHPIDALDREPIRDWAKQLNLRLPTEVEWEYACRAGTDTIFYWGDEPSLDNAWIETNFNETYPQSVEYRTLTAKEQKPPNAFGLLGMLGNLSEWVEDDEHEYYQKNHADSRKAYYSRYGGGNGILRGGWNNLGWTFNRSTGRVACSPDSGDTGCSARVAFDL